MEARVRTKPINGLLRTVSRIWYRVRVSVRKRERVRIRGRGRVGEGMGEVLNMVRESLDCDAKSLITLSFLDALISLFTLHTLICDSLPAESNLVRPSIQESVTYPNCEES